MARHQFNSIQLICFISFSHSISKHSHCVYNTHFIWMFEFYDNTLERLIGNERQRYTCILWASKQAKYPIFSRNANIQFVRTSSTSSYSCALTKSPRSTCLFAKCYYNDKRFQQRWHCWLWRNTIHLSKNKRDSVISFDIFI